MNVKFSLSSRVLKAGLPIVAALAVSACSITGFGPDVDRQQTSSIIPVNLDEPLDETVDPSDWDAIRAVMRLALSDVNDNAPLPWENAITGSVGTIVPLEVVETERGQLCRSFSTTLNGVGGVQQYRGNACRTDGGQVELVDVKSHDAVVDALPATSGDAMPQIQ